MPLSWSGVGLARSLSLHQLARDDSCGDPAGNATEKRAPIAGHSLS
jgi:hypothetical protein